MCVAVSACGSVRCQPTHITVIDRGLGLSADSRGRRRLSLSPRERCGLPRLPRALPPLPPPPDMRGLQARPSFLSLFQSSCSIACCPATPPKMTTRLGNAPSLLKLPADALCCIAQELERDERCVERQGFACVWEACRLAVTAPPLVAACGAGSAWPPPAARCGRRLWTGFATTSSRSALTSPSFQHSSPGCAECRVSSLGRPPRAALGALLAARPQRF